MARKENKPELTNLMDFYKVFPDDKSCREHLKKERFPDGKVACSKCGSLDKIYELADGKRYKCGDCKHIFTITVGTIFEASHIELQKWFLAIYIVSAHKKGISSLQLHRDIGVTQKTAWFMLHRIRYMLGTKAGRMMTGTVEADETYVGGASKKHKKAGRGTVNKTAVFGMVERQGDVRAESVARTDKKTLTTIIKKNISKDATIVTDEWASYNYLDYDFKHKVINHSKAYAIGSIHINTIEGFWSLLKRGIFGIYHSVSPKHLDRYCDEFEYRYNTRKVNDAQRFNAVFTQCGGRLTYATLINK